MLFIDQKEIPDVRYPDNTFRFGPNECRFLSDMQFYDHDASLEDPGDFYVFWQYEKPEEMFMLQCMVRHLRDRVGVNKLFLTMPYIPNARMDRTENPLIEVNTLKYFCQMINEMNFTYVMVCDPHSDAAINMLDRVVQIPLTSLGMTAFEMSGADYICFPDEGALKRYRKIYNFAPFFNGKKIRNWSTGVVESVVIENPIGIDMNKIDDDTRILIMDDICSRGGTFYYCALELQKLGFKHIDLYVTHCEESIFQGKLLLDDSPIEYVYTTDSLDRKNHSKIDVIKLDLAML